MKNLTFEEHIWNAAFGGASDIAKTKAIAEEILKDKEEVIKVLEHDLKFAQLELLNVTTNVDLGFMTEEEVQSLKAYSAKEQEELKRGELRRRVYGMF